METLGSLATSPASFILQQDPRQAAGEEKGPLSSEGCNLGINKVDGDRESLDPCRVRGGSL